MRSSMGGKGSAQAYGGLAELVLAELKLRDGPAAVQKTGVNQKETENEKYSN